MIKIFLKLSMISLMVGVLFLGCEKNTNNVFSEYDLVDQETNAFIKVNYNVAFYNNPSKNAAQLKINGVRVSGLLSTRYPFPGGGFNTLGGSTGDYFPIAPGNTEISLTIPKRGTNIDSVEIYKTTFPVAASKRYSLHVADTVIRKSLLVEENYDLPDSGFARMRFVNLMPNNPTLDLYNNTTKVASDVPYMGISNSFLLQIGTATSTVWNIRAGGSLPTSPIIATYTLTANIQNRRVYTAFATGYNTYPSTGTDVRRPFIAFYYVR